MFLFTWYRRLRLFIFRSQMRFGSWLVVKLRGDVGKYKNALWQSFVSETNPAVRADYEKVFREVFK